MGRIKRDHARFDRKIKKIRREGLKKYFSSDPIIIPQRNGKKIRIPIRNLETPRFRFGQNQTGGVAQGDGEVGDVLGDQQQGGQGKQHGDGEGNHSFGELDIEEAVQILGEELELPNLLDKFEGNIGVTSENKYTGISKVGPESLRHGRRTHKNALKRAIITGDYNFKDPIIIPNKSDRAYRSARQSSKPTAKAAIIYLLDSSGSMYSVIEFLQNVGWWADAWIQKHYDAIDRRYIQYDGIAKEVSANDLYSIDAGGGTSMNAGLSLTKKIIQADYPEYSHNVYLVHFTDGDCHDIDISESYVKQFNKWIEQYPDLEDQFETPEVGNPLTDYLIPRCNAIFVAEARVYSGNNNYSDMLDKLIDLRPSLGSKIRCKSFDDDEIEVGRGERIKEILQHWFK